MSKKFTSSVVLAEFVGFNFTKQYQVSRGNNIIDINHTLLTL